MTKPDNLSWLADVPVEIEASIPGPRMRISALLALRPGSVVPTTSRVGASVALIAGGARIGEGELSVHRARPTIGVMRLGGER